MTIKNEKELNEYMEIIDSLEGSSLNLINIRAWWLREYERIVLFGYKFDNNYLHN
tara:strand:- start:330 stop:494 length:165 start_codon:yes stop_codon:yes gene_type:complete